MNEIMNFLLSLLVLSGSTRKLYEKKLQKLLDDGPAQPLKSQLVVTEIQVNHNGNSESDLYSDKEDGKSRTSRLIIHTGILYTSNMMS